MSRTDPSGARPAIRSMLPAVSACVRTPADARHNGSPRRETQWAGGCLSNLRTMSTRSAGRCRRLSASMLRARAEPVGGPGAMKRGGAGSGRSPGGRSVRGWIAHPTCHRCRAGRGRCREAESPCHSGSPVRLDRRVWSGSQFRLGRCRSDGGVADVPLGGEQPFPYIRPKAGNHPR